MKKRDLFNVARKIPCSTELLFPRLMVKSFAKRQKINNERNGGNCHDEINLTHILLCN